MNEQPTPTPSTEIVLGGKTYTLRYTMGALNRIEGMYKKTVLELANDLAKVSTVAVTALVWGGILHDERAAKLSPSDVANLIELEQLTAITVALSSAIEAAFGKPKEVADAGKADGES